MRLPGLPTNSIWTSGELDRGSTNSLLSLRVADVIMHSKYSNRSDSADSGRGGDHDGQFPPTLTLFLVFFFLVAMTRADEI